MLQEKMVRRAEHQRKNISYCHDCYIKILSGSSIRCIRCENKRRTGKKHPLWNGGIKIDKDGYILVWMKKHPYKDSRNYIRKHRLVMEKKLGRYLKPREIVHHINENESDNRINNLMLFKNNSEHLKWHAKERRK